MSIDMYLNRSENQASDVSKLTKNISDGYDSLLQANSKFLFERELKGKAFDTGKQFFGTVISPLLISMKTLSNLTEQACEEFVNKYKSEVDSQSLKESELIEDINNLNTQITDLRNMNTSLMHKASKNRDAISGNDNMISSLHDQKEKLEKKLRKLRDFNQSSPEIFKEVEAFQQHVQQGIKQAQTSWDSGNQLFNIPSGKQLEWAKVAQEKYLDVEMTRINQKSQDKKLNNNDLNIVMNYAQKHPDEDVPQSLSDYLNQNKKSIAKDLKSDITISGIEQVGFRTQKFGSMLNTNGGFKGPEGKYSFVQVTNNSGNEIIKGGKYISKVGKYGGTTLTGVGFGIGMYNDIATEKKTTGEAISHNSLTTGAGIGAASGTSFLLASNPVGWVIVGSAVVGIGASSGVNYMYQTNKYGFKDGTDWVGHKLDSGLDWTGQKLDSGLDWTGQKIDSGLDWTGQKIDSGLDWTGQKINQGWETYKLSFECEKLMFNYGYDQVKNNINNTVNSTKSNLNQFNNGVNKLKNSIHEVHEVTNYASKKLKRTKKAVDRTIGQAVKVKNNFNSLKWSW